MVELDCETPYNSPNSLFPGKYCFDLEYLIFKCVVVVTFISFTFAIAFMWTMQDTANDASMLV